MALPVLLIPQEEHDDAPDDPEEFVEQVEGGAGRGAARGPPGGILRVGEHKLAVAVVVMGGMK